MIKKIICIALALSLTACMGSYPQASLVSAMPKGEKTPAPNAFLNYCQRNPGDCAIPADKQLKETLNRINYTARTLVIPTPESGGDFWQRLDAIGPGDCEDFALTVRHQLRAAFPGYSAAFRIATAYTEDGQYHAVLSVETTHGTIVCDIRFPQCAPWTTFPYIWRMREIAGDNSWEVFSPNQILAATAATAEQGRR
ncbi:transglutaminase-like cysteine peptidase [Kordiimonas sp.]|uniref:transglutaminase-like cysteine peptidase n=1 Tax=Kordiimonas sp. TaxID=1970157 RepID=UPI003A93EAD6